MATNKILPTVCPSCGGGLRVQTMHCPECGTSVAGDYPLPALMRLAVDKQAFVKEFVECSGSLKEMASRMGLSYPTVRNKLDEIIEDLKNLDRDGE